MSYSNYSTYLKYKNCCRPIGDTGPPGPAGPTGPAATLDVPGNKGEILYFSETDTLDSTNTIFITNGNVNINNNLVVSGTTNLNNTLDVSGTTTINNGTLKVLNPNDKNSSQFQTSQGSIFLGASNITRFGDVSYNLIFSSGGTDNNGLAIGTLSNNEPLILGVDNTEVIRINDNGDQRVGIKTSNPSATLQVNGNVIINANLSMDDNFINDVSGIYFSDGTYIGDGSSFDIKTKQLLDINATGGISITGNLTLNNATTVNKTLNVVGNTTLKNLFVNGYINNLIEISGNTIQPIISEYVNLGYDELGSSSNDKRFNLGFFNKIKSRTAVIVGNLSMDDSFINDVSGIYFSDGTYIGHGSSFDITTSETLDISATGGINLNTDVTINSNITINSNLTANTIHTQRLLFPGGNYIDGDEGVGVLYVNGNTTLAHRVQLFSTLDVSGATTIRSNLSMNNNFIKDVYTIDFSNGSYIQDKHGELRIQPIDGLNITTGSLGTNHFGKFTIQDNNKLRFNNDNTYITSNTANDRLSLYGNSIFMEAGINGDFTFTGNSNNVDLNFLTQSATGFTINYKDSDDKLRFIVNDLVIDKTNNYIGIQTDSPSATLEVNGNAIINGNLSMNGNIIDQINFIQFTDINGKIYSPLQRNALLFYNNINTNSTYKNCVYSSTDSSNNGLISSQIFNTSTNKITFSNAVLNTFNYATFSVSCSGLLIGGAKNDIIFDVSASSGTNVTNFLIDTRSISGNGTVTFGPVTYKVTDNPSFTKSIFYTNTYDLRVKSNGNSQYTLSNIKLSVNLI